MSGLKIAIVENCFQHHKNLEEAHEAFYRGAVQAYDAGADMVLFPPLSGMTGLASVAGDRWSFGPEFADLVERHGTFLEEQLIEWIRSLSRLFRLYICPGSLYRPTEDGIVHRSHLFDPEGKLSGWQDQVHLSAVEKKWGLTSGSRLRVFTLKWGRAGIVLGTDAYFPETSRLFNLKGAELLVSPNLIPGRHTFWQQMAGLWKDIQQNQCYGIESCLNGDVGGLSFEGKASCYVPCELSQGESGILAQGRSVESGSFSILTAELDFQKLRRFRRDDLLLKRLNPDLYRRQLLGTYESYEKAANH